MRRSHADPVTHRLIDLSHSVEDGMVTYRGIPPPAISDFLSRDASRTRYAPGTEFHIGQITMAANTGTYLDSPFHRYADGLDLAALRLEQLAELEAVVVRSVDPAAFLGLEMKGKAVLVHTGWDRHWRTERYFEGHQFLTEQTARHLVRGGAALVGIDSLNIDATTDGRRPVHTILLGAGIPIVEHLCGLERLPDAGFRFSAVPVKVK